ncbi:TATA box-binding protein-associated factor RNA polymerase I subunit B [Rhododendron vialii]|uniref:TATA box-binding protein-associated factor RNA polymerase I subunit B n=1 Tax=Rhododendron vialii TaxID=182163 RepID=UPI00265D7087|nr:TATA box-binding protein-associated factor RNA polymerase I subunit B [Rhododendron vialii]XP_058193437.1 TATA box-binding protein-associated factor RNA polymerase I subunit B [Rhododendron vialii]
MTGKLVITCDVCGAVGRPDESDGFYYCPHCGSQAADIVDTAVADEDLIPPTADGGGGIYSQLPCRRQVIKAEPISYSQPQSLLWKALEAAAEENGGVSVKAERDDNDGVGPTGPGDFGPGSGREIGYDEYYSELRMRYVMGVQMMVQMQCKALVEVFGVSPLVRGLAGTVWLRLVAVARVFDDNWADECIQESESQKDGLLDDFKPRAKFSAEPHNIHGQRAVTIWYRSLRRSLPLSCSLAISFLVCHLAREAVLPTDIVKWTLEGKLPYFSAFVEIEKQIGPPPIACPLSSSFLFKPSETFPLQKLESQAASIAQTIGLELPPVNFYAIASRYLSKLSLPVGKILPSVCQIYEWSLPPELWLSANEFRLPTCVCVLSMVIVAIRILYNIHGFGFWEMSLSSSGESSSGNGQVEPTCNASVRDDAKQGFPCPGSDDSVVDSSKKTSHERFDAAAAELLCNLESRYNELKEIYEYSKDLPTYLQYCNDVVFAGLKPSFEDFEEEKIIEELWNYYQDQKDSGSSDYQEVGCNNGSNHKRSRDDVMRLTEKSKKRRDDSPNSCPSTDLETSQANDCSQQTMSLDGCALSGNDPPVIHQKSSETKKDNAIMRMKSNMEENRFYYIPPRVNVKRLDYLHYVRKKDDGAYTYAAHADYYILLRSCARVAQVDIRVMHAGVLSFEKRLGWLEKRIDHCLNLGPPNDDSCEFCREDVPKDSMDDSIDVSKLNL